LPDPNDGEKESDYVSRCIPIVKKEHPDWENDQCAAVCHSMYKQKNSKEVLAIPLLNETKDSFMNRCLNEKQIEVVTFPNVEAFHAELTSLLGDSLQLKSIREDEMKKACEDEWKNRVIEEVPRDPDRKPDPGQSGDGRGDGQYKKDSSSRVLMHLCASQFNFSSSDISNNYDINRGTILVGDGVYNGIYFPAEEIEKAFMTWDRQPINLNHSDNVEDEVGYITEPMYDKVSKRLTVKPVIDDSFAKANMARGFIAGRIRAGKIPEVSVGVWMDKVPIENLEQQKNGALFTAKNLQGDHLAIVSRGACSPQAGCGIGLKNDDVTVTLVDNKYDYSEMEKKKLEIEIEKLKLLKLEV